MHSATTPKPLNARILRLYIGSRLVTYNRNPPHARTQDAAFVLSPLDPRDDAVAAAVAGYKAQQQRHSAASFAEEELSRHDGDCDHAVPLNHAAPVNDGQESVATAQAASGRLAAALGLLSRWQTPSRVGLGLGLGSLLCVRRPTAIRTRR